VHNLFYEDPYTLYGLATVFPAVRELVWSKIFDPKYKAKIAELGDPHAALKLNGFFPKMVELFGDRLTKKRELIKTIIFCTDSDPSLVKFKMISRIFDDFSSVENIEFHNISFIMADFPWYTEGLNKLGWLFHHGRPFIYVKFVNCSFVEEQLSLTYDPGDILALPCFPFYFLMATEGYRIRFENTGKVSLLKNYTLQFPMQNNDVPRPSYSTTPTHTRLFECTVKLVWGFGIVFEH
jgi:hypothetical protein